MLSFFILSSEPLSNSSFFLFSLYRFGVAKVSKFFFLTSVCEKIFKLFLNSYFNQSPLVCWLSVVKRGAKVIIFFILASFSKTFF